MLQTQQSIRAQMLIVEVKGELQALSAQQCTWDSKLLPCSLGSPLYMYHFRRSEEGPYFFLAQAADIVLAR